MPNLIFEQIEDQKQSVLETIQANLNGSNLSINGLSKLCTVADTSIVRGSALANKKLAEILTQQGFECSALIEEGFNAQATWLVIEYFAFHSKAKAEGAKQIARTFGAFGIHQIFSKINGEEEKPESKPERQLPPVRDAIDFINAGEQLEKFDNPMLRAILEQRLMEDATQGLTLPESQQMCVLTVRAKELGYSEKEIGSGSKLGKYVAKYISPEGKQKHGRYEVNTYLQTEQLDEVIQSYFR